MKRSRTTVRSTLVWAALAAATASSSAGAISLGASADSVRLRDFNLRSMGQAEKSGGSEYSLFAAPFGKPESSDKTTRFLKVGVDAATGFTTNPAYDFRGSPNSGRLSPAGVLEFGISRGNWNLTGLGKLIYDATTAKSAPDRSYIVGNVTLTYSGSDTGIVPMISYSPTQISGNFFDGHLATFHDIFGGIAYPTKIEKSQFFPEFLLTTYVGYERRESSDPGQEQHRPKLRFTVESSVGKDQGIDVYLEQLIEGQMYSASYSRSQSDLHFATTFAMGCKLGGAWRVSLGAKLESFESNEKGHDYRFFEIGPRLSARW